MTASSPSADHRTVTGATMQRRSTRAFLDTPVDNDLIARLLETAGRAPSGGNLQPWVIYVLNDESIARFRKHLTAAPPFDEAAYEIYPPSLWEPHRTNRFAVGEQLYGALGIERADKLGRMEQFAHNGDFFGAPAGLFCLVDRRMGAPQWSDLGMFLQTFMLLATEAGLGTCAQEYWSARSKAVTEFLDTPPHLMLFCGLAIGYEDPEAPINSFKTERMPLSDWATFVD